MVYASHADSGCFTLVIFEWLLTVSVAACGFTALVSRHSVSFTMCLPRHTAPVFPDVAEVVDVAIKLSFRALLRHLHQS